MFLQGAKFLDAPFQDIRWVKGAVADGVLLQEPLATEKRRFRRPGEVVAEGVERLRRFAQEMPQRAGKAVAEIQQRPAQLREIWRRDLGRGARCWRPEIRHEIRDRKINLMPHRRDDRDFRSRDRAGYDLLVEAPEILQRSAAAPHDEHIAARISVALRRVELFDGPRDFPLGPPPLHPHREKHRLHPRRAPLEDIEDVLDRRARRRGHNSDDARENGQFLFPIRIEKPLGVEFSL